MPNPLGNFPTFVYIKVPETSNLEQFARFAINQSLNKGNASYIFFSLFLVFISSRPSCNKHSRFAHKFIEDFSVKSSSKGHVHRYILFVYHYLIFLSLNLILIFCRLPLFFYYISLTLVAKIKEHLKEFRLKSFDVSLESKNYQYFQNEDFSRTFLSMNTVKGKREIINLISIIDSVQKLFEFPLFYEDPKPHSSIAWSNSVTCINNSTTTNNNIASDSQIISSDSPITSSSTNSLITSDLTISEVKIGDEGEIQKNLEDFVEPQQIDLDEFEFEVDQIYCKIGQWIFSFPL